MKRNWLRRQFGGSFSSVPGAWGMIKRGSGAITAAASAPFRTSRAAEIRRTSKENSHEQALQNRG